MKYRALVGEAVNEKIKCMLDMKVSTFFIAENFYSLYFQICFIYAELDI